MRKILFSLAAIAALFASPAYADFTGKDASAATITFKNPGTCSSVVCVPVFQIYDGTNVVTLTTAGADGVSNTLTGVPMYGRNLVFNGTTWDRWLGDATNGAFVNVKTSVLPTGAATSANQTTEISSLATIATNTGAAIPAGSANIGGVELIDSGGTNKASISAAGAVKTDGSAVTQPVSIATAPVLVAGTARVGYTSDDPCTQKIKLNAPFTTTSAGPVSIVALSGSTVIYICAISAIADTAIKLSFIDGTGGSCASAQHAIWGSTTAANGMSLAANGGFTMGSGNGSVGVTTAASAFCLLQSGTSLVAGNITYVQQ